MVLMSSEDKVTSRVTSLWGFATAPAFVLVASLAILSQKTSCEVKYLRSPLGTDTTSLIKQDWVCNQAINGIDVTGLTIIGVVIGLVGILVGLIVITIRDRNSRTTTS
jgi:hypothetical protein